MLYDQKTLKNWKVKVIIQQKSRMQYFAKYSSACIFNSYFFRTQIPFFLFILKMTSNTSHALHNIIYNMYVSYTNFSKDEYLGVENLYN